MLESHGVLLQRIITEVPPIVSTALAFIKDPTKAGAYLCVTDFDGRLELEIPVGSFKDVQRSIDCAAFALEKNRRLAAHPNHLSSFESADEDEGKYPGAIRGDNFLWSLSALPALWDEACMLSLALRVNEISVERVRKIIEISKNPFAHHLLPDGTLP